MKTKDEKVTEYLSVVLAERRKLSAMRDHYSGCRIP